MAKQFKKAVIFGTFDIVHSGHISLFKFAKKYADKLFVVLARDKNIHKAILFNENKRLENLRTYSSEATNVLKQYKIIDKIILGDLKNPLAFYKKLKPDLAIIGYDQFKYVNLLKTIDIAIKKAPSYHEKLFKTRKIKNIFQDKDAGFYLMNKEKGYPSFKTVSILRKILNMKKIGFSGTLDPMACGLLILASGKATKFLDTFHLLNKIYKAKIELGKISNTFDAEGKIIKSKNQKIKKSRKEIEDILKNKFTGEIMQTPPIFSAKKIKGRKAYELVRKNHEVRLKPVKININEIKILAYKYPSLTLKINCSKGTYIRSIANDLGKELKTGGILVELKRTKIGPFDLKNAVEQNEINSENLEKNKLSILNVIQKINGAILK